MLQLINEFPVFSVGAGESQKSIRTEIWVEFLFQHEFIKPVLFWSGNYLGFQSSVVMQLAVFT